MLILYNSKIYTLDPQQPVTEAVVIDHGRILAAGDNQTILSAFSGKAEKIDASETFIIPGICDAHIHLQDYALFLNKINCETPSRAECLALVAERARNTPQGEWISGHGWNDSVWEGGIGDPGDLNWAVSTHPVYLSAKSLHAAWVNRAALDRVGIGAGTPDPSAGRIGRDEHGQPNGLLYESAMDLVYSKIPEPEPEQLVAAIRNAQLKLAQMGITSLHDFDPRSCFVALQTLHARGELRLRVIKGLPVDDLPQAIGLGIQTGFGDDILRVGGVKMFADGALGPRTAAMLEPYTGEPANSGMLILDAEGLYERGKEAVKNHISLCIHAIGDLANREVLNALERLRELEKNASTGEQSPLLRHRIEHVQLIHPDDALRLAQLNVIASMQPIHATSDMVMVEKWWRDRSSQAYAWRTILNSGAKLVFGSDAPVETPDPFQGLYAAVTRRRADGSPNPEGWHPEQKLSRTETLNAYCTGPAFAAGLEDRLGKLSAGYLADLMVLDTDPFTCEAEQLIEIHPRATLVAGEWVFQR